MGSSLLSIISVHGSSKKKNVSIFFSLIITRKFHFLIKMTRLSTKRRKKMMMIIRLSFDQNPVLPTSKKSWYMWMDGWWSSSSFRDQINHHPYPIFFCSLKKQKKKKLNFNWKISFSFFKFWTWKFQIFFKF